MSEPIILKKIMPLVGMRDLVYARVMEDTAEGVDYGSVKAIAGVMGFGFVPGNKEAVGYGDDGVFARFSGNTDAEGSLELNTIPKEMEIDWFGHKVDANGIVSSNKDDICNPVAIGFKAMKTDGHFRYVWVYNVEPSQPEDTYRTLEDGATIQTKTIAMKCTPRKYDGEMQAKADTDDETITDKTIFTNWLKAVYERTPVTPDP